MARILVVDPYGAVGELVADAARHTTSQPEVVTATTLDPVGCVAARYDVIVAGPGLDTGAGLRSLARVQDADPAVSIVFAFDQRPRVSLASVVRAGAVDLLAPDADPATVTKALERAMAIAAARRRGTVAERRGTVVTVASASGGCGKTFFAVNAAYHLHKRTGGRACIIDLDLQFGEVVTALRLRPTLTVFDVREREQEGTLADHLEEYMVRHPTGVHVLPAPRDPSEADRIDPQDVIRIIEAARSRFDYVVVDTPPALTEVVLAALDLSEVLYVMATLDVPSVRNLGVFLSTLDRLKVPRESVRLIMNKAEDRVGMQVDEVARLFPGGFTGVLPYASVVSRSLNQGEPVLAAFPSAEVSKRLAHTLAALLPADARHDGADVVDGPARGRLVGRLFRRPQLQTAGGAR